MGDCAAAPGTLPGAIVWRGAERTAPRAGKRAGGGNPAQQMQTRRGDPGQKLGPPRMRRENQV
jgi:hypothetical protein